jgi:predicted NAD/FAD-dependent oxidoreductase
LPLFAYVDHRGHSNRITLIVDAPAHRTLVSTHRPRTLAWTAQGAWLATLLARQCGRPICDRPAPTKDGSTLHQAASGQTVSCGRVAIIGAGVAGLGCARTLRNHGVDVVVFDKGRSAGGRLASHRSGDFDADVGAPYFTIREEGFGREVQSWLAAGVVASWPARVLSLPSAGAKLVETPAVARYVAVPTMSALARHLSRDIAVQTSHRVDEIDLRDGRFILSGVVGAAGTTLGPRDPGRPENLQPMGEFDTVVVCLPADQAHPLVRRVHPALADAVAQVRCEPCLALAFVPKGDVLRHLPCDGVFFGRDGDADRTVAWLCRESSKPGRRDDDTWVLHADSAWSQLHLRDPDEDVQAALLGALSRWLAISPFAAQSATLRRWAFARGPSQQASGPLWDAALRLGVGGDWTLGGRIEGAYSSGVALAGRVLGREQSMAGV